MAHKAECAKFKDANAACSLNCETPTTRICGECGQEIGATEKKCPKCGVDLELADAEDAVVQRSLKRIATRNKAAKRKTPPTPTTEPVTPKHPFTGLGKMFK